MGWSDGDFDIVMLYNGQPLRVHGPKACTGERCPIHNPTKHHMNTWAHNWREDRGILERVCPCHGVGHPDPDDVRVRFQPHKGVHGCHGCCRPPELVPA
jgi:hypothetical protein